MKIKVKTTFRRAFSLMLCMVMLFGIAPFSGMVAGASDRTYTITCYQSNDSDVILWEESYAEGDTIVKPANVQDPKRTGYEFDYWSDPIPETMPGRNISTTAQWKVLQFTITFAETGDSVISPITQDYNSPITKPANPTRAGYTFVGWDIEDSAEFGYKFPTTMPAKNITIKAKWEISKNKIVFDTAGGTYIEPIEKDFGEAINPPANPEKTGYTFLGWKPELPSTMPAGGMYVTAQWQINKYTIKFETKDGTEIPAITQDYDTIIVKPEAPTKEGYTFKGWSEPIPDRMPVIPGGTKIIEAVWVPNKIDITYDPNGGHIENIYTEDPTDTTENPITVKYTYGLPFTHIEHVAITPEHPIRNGYIFAGWFDKDGNSPEEVPSEPTTYYASWIEGTGECVYRVTIHKMEVDGSYKIVSENRFSGAVGETVTAEYTTPTGFALDSAKSTLTGTLTEANKNENLELHVYLKRNEYTITLNGGGGIFNNDKKLKTFTITARYGEVVDVTATLENKGYTFDSWIEDGTGKPATIPTLMPADDTSFTAKWIANGDTPYKVIVTYKDVANNNEPVSKPYIFYGTTGSKVKIYLDSIAAEPGVIKHNVSEFYIEHYKVDRSAAAMANHVLEAKIAAVDDVEDPNITVLKIEYIPVNYNVTFTVAGKVIETKEVQYYSHAKDIEPTETIIKERFDEALPGYSFVGWEPELGRVTGDIEYKAKYKSNSYNVEFKYAKVVYDDAGNKFSSTSITPDAGQEIDSFYQDFNTEFKVPNYPKKTGYTCVGWYDATGRRYNPGQNVKVPKDGIVLTAEYTANLYTITFDENLAGASYTDKEFPGYIQVLCDDEIALPALPVKEGCKCLGWYFNGKLYQAGDKFTMPAGDITIKANWNVGKYNIVYRDGDKVLTDLTKKDISCGDKITAPKYPSDSYVGNRTFIGWREKGETELFVHDEMPGYSLTLEAVWGYTVTFVDDNNAIIKKVAFEPGAKIVAPEIPYRTGTVANGWIALPDKMPNHDLVIKASRIYIEYTITYKVDGDVYAQQTCQYGQTIPEIGAPSKWFKKFAGWNGLPETMPAYDIEVNAEWTDSDFVKGIKAFFDGIVKFLNIILGFIN